MLLLRFITYPGRAIRFGRVAIKQSPPPLWASTWEMMACHLVALHKATWVHLVGIGEFIRLLLAKCFLLLTGATETDVYGNFDLCSG